MSILDAVEVPIARRSRRLPHHVARPPRRPATGGQAPPRGRDRLRCGFTPRAKLDLSRVETLVETDGKWSPLLVHAGSMTIIDGAHRFTAAKRFGLRVITVRLFEGSVEEAASRPSAPTSSTG